MIEFACPGCRAVYRVLDDKAGKTGKCPTCASHFTIPDPAGIVAPPPPPIAPPPPPPEVVETVPVRAEEPPGGPVAVEPCPECGTRLAVEPADLGTEVECPNCDTVFRARRAAPRNSAGGSATRRSLGGRASLRDDRDDERRESRRPSRRDRDDEDDDEDDRPRRRSGRRSGRDAGDGSPVFGYLSFASGIVSLVSSLLSTPFACCCVLFGPVGFALTLLFGGASVVLGVVGLSTCRREKWASITGLVLSGVALLIAVVVTFFGALLLAAFNGPANNNPFPNDNAFPQPNPFPQPAPFPRPNNLRPRLR